MALLDIWYALFITIFFFFLKKKGKWLGSRQIRCNWATKGAGSNDDKQSSDAKSVVELTNGSSGVSIVVSITFLFFNHRYLRPPKKDIFICFIVFCCFIIIHVCDWSTKRGNDML